MYSETLEKLIGAAQAKVGLLSSSKAKYWIVSMLAGMYVGLGIILIMSIGGMMGDSPVKKIIMGISFGIALSLVIMAGSELFTGNNMIMTAASLEKKVKWSDTFKIWGWSWFGNWAGSIFVAALFVLSGLATGKTGEFIAGVASSKMTAAPVELFFRAMLCNILVCLAVLTSLKLKEESAKLIMIWWCLFAFITSGFEHSIANMTLLTIALFTSYGGDVTLSGYFYNLGVVGLGNLVGGAFVLGWSYWMAGRTKMVQ